MSEATKSATTGLEPFFQQRGWEPFQFQRDTWDAYARGQSGLIHAPTGMGKSYAAWGGPIASWMQSREADKDWGESAPPLRVLWITPLRALAHDTARTLREPLDALGLPWDVQLRTGDTTSTQRAKQRKRLPTTLITTPESLSLLLSYSDAKQKFRGLEAVVIDEWHELMSTKRGTQTELCLARLRQWNPELRTWGLSATLGNLDEAAATLLGTRGEPPTLIHDHTPKRIEIETLLPPDVQRFPWAGHLGVQLVKPVIDAIERGGTTLMFCNTRSQVELWFQALMRERPEWIGRVAVHHGSLELRLRRRVEALLREGKVRCVVCTSSLDLGVDFSPVDQVMQVGSPKGVARLMQRAGRSGHQPGRPSVVLGVPTHALEVMEFAAARDAIQAKRIESRRPLDRPMDVLAQHLVTLALGGGFMPDEVFDEVRGAHAYRDLTREQFGWALEFVTRGGRALEAYPEYRRVDVLADGTHAVSDRKAARRHRMTIGTITSDGAIDVRFGNGKKLGTVEESFVAHLAPGQRFVFAGRLLELIQLRNMTATVKQAKGKKATVPRWQGGKTPLSTQLADAMRARLESANLGVFDTPEMHAVRPLLELQSAVSAIPERDELLVETIKTRDGHHLFLFPFAGRLAHEGLGALLAYRMTRPEPRSVMVTVNDYGLELLSPQPWGVEQIDWANLFSSGALIDHLLECMNTSQLARRRFRGIARVAGLVFPGFPGQGKSARQMQASSELFFDVLSDFDPDSLLLEQARREVLESQLEVQRIRRVIERVGAMTPLVIGPDRLSPLAFPLWAERLREQHVTTEKWSDRVQRMAEQLERQAH